MDTEKQRQRRRDDASLTESRNARSEQLLVVPTESLTNRVWLEWIRTLKARLVFRYEVSDLIFMMLLVPPPHPPQLLSSSFPSTFNLSLLPIGRNP